MKLIDLLKITDDMSDIVIWEYNASDTDEPLYTGPIFDVPWSITEMHLARGLEGNKYMLSVRNSEDGEAILIVSVSGKDTTIHRMKGFEI